MTESVPNRPLDYYTCAFRKSKMSRFLGWEDHDTYFTNTQRHRVVYEILARTAYGKRKKAEVGVDRLLNEGAYTAAFPLHEGPFQLPKHEVRPDELNQRQVLYYYWARWCKWYKYQPLDHIREYFGEKIALYFAWLGKIYILISVVQKIWLIFLQIKSPLLPKSRRITESRPE
ncbi:anoctamin-7-like, partial [Neolamprologus brichardi]|uniref:anoctamin-7-like n=1 Tax=Neolamprologus brichardi TaxID=32507 RepID=UPI001643A002